MVDNAYSVIIILLQLLCDDVVIFHVGKHGGVLCVDGINLVGGGESYVSFVFCWLGVSQNSKLLR